MGTIVNGTIYYRLPNNVYPGNWYHNNGNHLPIGTIENVNGTILTVTIAMATIRTGIIITVTI